MTYGINAAGVYGISDSYAVYLANEPLRPRHESLVPFAFFQAVKAGDFQEARYFLSGSLNKEIDSDEALAAYFADYDVIEENRYFPEIPDCVIIKSARAEKNTAALLQYKLDGDGKLEDFSIHNS